MHKQHKQQQGLVAIIVTVVISVIISLIVLSFAKFSRQSEVQTLDRQLNTQALYAAETGVNDALKAINDHVAAGNTPAEKADCAVDAASPNPYDTLATKTVLDAAGEVEYTCLLVDPAPEKLNYPNVQPFEPIIVPIETSQITNSIKLEWRNVGAGGKGEVCGTFSKPQLPPGPSWSCSTAMLRVDLIPDFATNNFNNMRNFTYTTFIYPKGAGGSALPNPLNSGQFNDGNCSSDDVCKFTFTGLTNSILLDPPSGENRYYLRIIPLYKAANVVVSAEEGMVAAPAEIKGAQAVIDVTGRARDIVKRIRVHAPVFQTSDAGSLFGVQSGTNFCKQYEFVPPGGTNYPSGRFFADGSACSRPGDSTRY